MPLPAYLPLWAKTSERADGPANHPLAYHLLDVAAVAERLLVGDRLLAELAARQGVAVESLARYVVLLVSLHDIGKASVAFQALAPQLAPGLAVAGFAIAPLDCAPRPHGALTAHYLESKPAPGSVAGVLDALAPGLLDGARLRPIVDPIAGHHGRPVKARDFDGATSTANAPFRAAANALATDLAALLAVAPLPKAFLRRAPRDLAAFSWLLAALTPVADWLGSKQDWFPPHAPTLDPAAYWSEIARPAAQRAVAASGLVAARIAKPEASRTLPGFAEPTPLQHHLLTCDLPAGPALFAIEDATGAGKTEAALTLAHRLMAAGAADGFHFALPTTATADAMFARLGPAYHRLFEDGAAPADPRASLVLAHGRARMKNEEDGPVASFCADWIADDRRKAFLAQAGAGTVDQALLAVLPSKYQSLRLHGLRGKVLIVDEVHAYDSYMQRELEALLELHATLRGSAILMSATLPLATRQSLVRAFQRGLGRGEEATLAARAYPLITMASQAGIVETPLDLACRSHRRVAVERVGCVEEAERLVARLADRGACVALIRTTVDAAIASFDRLTEKLGPKRVELLHSRFLPEDRRRNEDSALRRFDKSSTPDGRRGRVLVATQVIEQSLDLDFDAMVSDLAPIDLLIQRAGRLHRHARERRPVVAPVLHVIAPEPRGDADAAWLDGDLPEAKWVYGDVALLWLSARTLFAAGAIETTTLREADAATAHVRRLVDAVYEVGQDALPTQSLRDVGDGFRGKGFAERSLASLGLLDPADGYVLDDRKWESEARVATRLEQPPRVTIRLARVEAGSLVPFAGSGSWTASEIRATQAWARGVNPPDASEVAALLPAWTEADEGLRLFVVDAADAAGAPGFAYDPVRGLLRVRRIN